MAWMEILSPHNGKTVRVRDKDVGRSVRDGDGKIFYVLRRTNRQAQGEGDSSVYFGSLTRLGGLEQEKKYDEMAAKQEQARDVGHERSQQQIHDATGSKRSNKRGKFVIFALIIAMLGVVVLWLFTVGPLGDTKWQKTPMNSKQTDSSKDNAEQDKPSGPASQ